MNCHFGVEKQLSIGVSYGWWKRCDQGSMMPPEGLHVPCSEAGLPSHHGWGRISIRFQHRLQPPPSFKGELNLFESFSGFLTLYIILPTLSSGSFGTGWGPWLGAPLPLGHFLAMLCVNSSFPGFHDSKSLLRVLSGGRDVPGEGAGLALWQASHRWAPLSPQTTSVTSLIGRLRLDTAERHSQGHKVELGLGRGHTWPQSPYSPVHSVSISLKGLRGHRLLNQPRAVWPFGAHVLVC